MNIDNRRATDMDSAGMTSDEPVGPRLALFGLFVSRLMAFCLLYFAPALASVPGASGPAPVPVQAVDGWERGTDSPVAETLDPKHDKDHDQAREGEHGRGQIRG